MSRVDEHVYYTSFDGQPLKVLFMDKYPIIKYILSFNSFTADESKHFKQTNIFYKFNHLFGFHHHFCYIKPPNLFNYIYGNLLMKVKVFFSQVPRSHLKVLLGNFGRNFISHPDILNSDILYLPMYRIKILPELWGQPFAYSHIG